ncbi:thiamine ABC transporter ATP-binding protein [Pararhodobacter zhoushanensis]|uniref:ATP-binding cassette domain-containing protein n=1 Tax=Pararhodobacter zhoushanensis TaxID=2479545 RepID=A0ABT3GTK6_9RHOB|nr:ATP-binding cassette domain-containing protein [Pararhodobacter zhoushanensis]MCW1930861.1 ATP-binding cassette domain-containing protein [Pararhodobacter zhoushanensis]
MLGLDGVEIVLGSFRLAADLSVPQGARIAVMGPSGAGKSTLIGAVAGFVPLAAGAISWQGARIDGLAPALRPLSILFQDNNLLPHLSVFDNVALGVNPNLRLSTAQKAAVGQALVETGLSGLEARKPAQLSGGQVSRAGLARVLLRARPMILLDEPFSALGPALKRQMLDLVARIADETGATLLMITHDPEDALRLCDQTIVVAEGRAAPPAATGALLADPPPALKAYLG